MLVGKIEIGKSVCRKAIYMALIVMCFHIYSIDHIEAKVQGRCDNCHTMHNSQNGDDMDPNGPRGNLLKNDCIGCHSSGTSSTYYDLNGCKVPVVLYTGGEPTTYLAGGNFWWVKEGLGNDDSKGHNVFLGEDDDVLNNAPGHVGNGNGCTNSCHFNLSQIYPNPGWSYGDCNDKYGCEGCHHPRHHANDHTNGVSGLADNKDKGWYRFLVDPHSISEWSTEKGVKGNEDSVWEAGHPNHTPGTTSHNVYIGYNASHGAGDLDKGNLSSFCGGCHENFDRAYGFSTTQGQEYATSGPVHQYWIRHPSDAVIPDSGEYGNVGGDSHLYDPLSPVAEDYSGVNWTPSSTVTPGSDCVMCLSCHRPHGSPYPDMLRWDYPQDDPGGEDNGKGCFYCHTQKDD